MQVEDDGARYTHIRLNMFPDGGIARLRVYGEVSRDWSRVPVRVTRPPAVTGRASPVTHMCSCCRLIDGDVKR